MKKLIIGLAIGVVFSTGLLIPQTAQVDAGNKDLVLVSKNDGLAKYVDIEDDVSIYIYRPSYGSTRNAVMQCVESKYDYSFDAKGNISKKLK